MRMELLHLNQFRAIAELENMTQAAKQLHISQPTLSAMLKRLEDELEVALFIREKNRLILTEAGRLLLHHANIIIEAQEKAVAEIHLLKERSSEFRVGFCDPGPMWYYSPRYNMNAPQKEMKAEVYPDIYREAYYLQNENYDVIISYGRVDHPQIESIPLVHEYFMLSVPKRHPAAMQKSISIREAKLPDILLLYVEGSFFQGQHQFWQEMEPYTRIEKCTDFFLYQQRIKNTDVPTLSTFLSKNYRDDGDGRVLIPISDPELSIDYHVSYLKKNRKKLAPFLEWIKKA